jgi:tRNA/tmRNA/rRNA uracil-C5-methylase (TrmA/RlmC/RlmD family)
MENTFEFEITDIAFGGNGLGRKDGFVYFVPGTLPGELVLAEELSRKKNYGTARLVEILRSSQNRIIPACPLAWAPCKNNKSTLRQCPGCSYQHVKYEEEVKIKNRHLENFIRHNLKTDPKTVMDDPIASPKDLNYRNKIVLHFSEGKLGYFGEDNSTIIDVCNCPIAKKEINGSLVEIRKDLKKFSYASELTLRYTEKNGVQHWIDNRASTGTLEEETSFGTLEAPRRSFFQINLECADMLAGAAVGIIKDLKAESLVDLFCGCGFFSMAACREGISNVYGADSDSEAISAAIRNVAKLGFEKSCRFYAKSAELFLADNTKKINRDTSVLLLDPPRGGLSPKLRNLLITSGFRKLVYISCAPDTMARDMKLFCECGYALKKARLFDMFPRTSHFETIAYLEK